MRALNWPGRRRLLLLLIGLSTLAACEDHPLPTAVSARPNAAIGPAFAVVNSLADDGDGTCTTKCTLRDALHTGAGEITFSVNGSITLALGELPIVMGVRITGPGAANLTVSGNNASRVFSISEGTTAVITGLTITGGNTTGSGGGILNKGSLILDSCVVKNSRAALNGGGIANMRGTTLTPYLTVEHSTVSGSKAGYNGGGIWSYNGIILVSHSTVARDTADAGGGIYSDAYGLTSNILQSTVSGNVSRFGAGIYNEWGTLRIVLSTVTGNSSPTAGEGDPGGGVAWTDDLATSTVFLGSIVWGNTSGGTAVDVSTDNTQRRSTTLGYNLIGAAGPNVDFTQDFKGGGDQTGVADAKLGALASNGGPTQTHALLAGSPAIDVGTCFDHNNTMVTDDQRGIARPQPSVGPCDIGAFELESLGQQRPTFTFDLSTLPAKTYGETSFSVAGYASTNSSGAITFATGASSVGCSVTSAGLVTLDSAATGTNYCVMSASLAADANYYAAGPISRSFNIAKATLTVYPDDMTWTYGSVTGASIFYSGWVGSDDESSLGGSYVYTYAGTGGTGYGPSTTAPTNVGTYSVTMSGLTSNKYSFIYQPGALTINRAAGSVSINNIPTIATEGGSFTPTYTKDGDGVASVSTTTPSNCHVTAGMVSFDAAGTCTLEPSIAQGTNHLPATGTAQSFTISPAGPVFSSSCTYTINAKNDQRSVTVTWANASPGVTLIRVSDGRIVEKQMSPTANGSWSTKVPSGVPTYELRGGADRKDSSTILVAAGSAGSACTNP